MGSKHSTLKSSKKTLPIHIVYFTFFDTAGTAFHGSRSQKLILEQMNDLVKCGLNKVAKSIDIVLSTSKANNFNDATEQKIDEAKKVIHSILPNATVHKSPGNRFEYPGIRLVWDIANKIPPEQRHDSLILYFHSKGMNNGNMSRIKTKENDFLTKTVLYPWKNIVSRFKSDPKVEKAGYAASDKGFIWYNFWWARASYLVGCPRPILTDRRHYYEDWLGRRKRDGNTNPEPGDFKPPDNCLSLCVDGAKGELGIQMTHVMEKCKAHT
jgi:hypothetical protein